MIADILVAVEQAAAEIARLERKAAGALAAGDRSAHRGHLEEKTRLLIDLPEMLAPAVEALPADRAASVGAALDEIAEDARQAARLGSVFYMSALLYPADYQEAMDNELEALLGWLRQQ